MVDCRGEARAAIFTDLYYGAHNSYSEVIEYKNWEDYDNKKNKQVIAKLEKENQELEKTLQSLHASLREVYNITNAGGPHSRRRVKDIIKGLNICLF